MLIPFSIDFDLLIFRARGDAMHFHVNLSPMLAWEPLALNFLPFAVRILSLCFPSVPMSHGPLFQTPLVVADLG